MIDTEAYEAVITSIQSFIDKATEDVEKMTKAAEDCVDNTEDDEAAQKAAGKINKCTAEIHAQLEVLQGVQSAMQKEVEKAIAAARKVDSLNDY